MHVRILSTFLDGATRYEQGETRSMPDDTAVKFARRGWVLVDGVTPDAKTGGTLDLEIHNSRIGLNSVEI